MTVACERQARKIDLKELGVSRAVGGAVKDGVGVVEDVLWSPCLLKITLTVWYQLES